MITEFLIFVSVVLFTMFGIKKKVRKSYKIPGPKGYPIIGNALIFWGKSKDVFKRLLKLFDSYTRLVGFWIGPKLHVALYDPRDVEVVLKTSRFVIKADEYRFLRPWLGDSILLSTGNKFRKNKKILLPNFHTNILKNNIDVFNEHAELFVKNVENKIDKDEFDIQYYFQISMLSILLETSMGVDKKTLGSEGLLKYAKAVSDVCKIVHIRAYTFWLRNDWLFNFSKLKKLQNEALNVIHTLTAKVIKERKENMTNKPKDDYEYTVNKKKIVLDALLESERREGDITEQEIMDEVLTLMFAGQDTTAVSLSFILSLLGIYTDIQDKVYEEIKDIFGDSKRPVTFDDLQEMKYLERVIQETWRLYPPIPMIARKPTQDIALETCVLPRNCTIVVLIMKLHRNSRSFEKPNEFNPDNFLPEKIKSRHPCSFIPFSVGGRTCIGGKYAMMNIKVMLSTVLRYYKVFSKRKEKDFILVAETTLKRKEGFPIIIRRRDNPNLSIEANF